MNILYLRNSETGEFEPIPAIMGAPGVSPEVTVSKITGGHRVTIKDAEGEKYFDVMNGAGGSGGGVSPTVTVTKITGGNRVTITDANDTKSFDVKDGTNGVSPVVSIEEEIAGNTLSFTDAEGTKSIWISNGTNGNDGVGISSVSTVESNASGGNNTVTIRLTNNSVKTFNVKNGKDGKDGGDLTLNGFAICRLATGDGIDTWTDDYEEDENGNALWTTYIDVRNLNPDRIASGTFYGWVKANATSGGQTPATSLLRNSKLIHKDAYNPATDDPTVEGEIVWIYG